MSFRNNMAGRSGKNLGICPSPCPPGYGWTVDGTCAPLAGMAGSRLGGLVTTIAVSRPFVRPTIRRAR